MITLSLREGLLKYRKVNNLGPHADELEELEGVAEMAKTRCLDKYQSQFIDLIISNGLCEYCYYNCSSDDLSMNVKYSTLVTCRCMKCKLSNPGMLIPKPRSKINREEINAIKKEFQEANRDKINALEEQRLDNTRLQLELDKARLEARLAAKSKLEDEFEEILREEIANKWRQVALEREYLNKIQHIYQRLVNEDSGSGCLLCDNEEVDSVFIPCGHCNCCYDCAEMYMKRYENKGCPLCRSEVTGLYRLYRGGK